MALMNELNFQLNGIIQMRWEKNELFVEIENATSADGLGDIWAVKWHLDLNDFPVGLFRHQVRKSDYEGFAKLRQAISVWATSNGYEMKR